MNMFPSDSLFQKFVTPFLPLKSNKDTDMKIYILFFFIFVCLVTNTTGSSTPGIVGHTQQWEWHLAGWQLTWTHYQKKDTE